MGNVAAIGHRVFEARGRGGAVTIVQSLCSIADPMRRRIRYGSPGMKFPPRAELAQRPTPLQALERMGKHLGVELLVKRDDLTGAELSGNKIRKLEFLLADAQAKGCDTVITGGGAQSNHCRATALAATRLGLSSVVCLRTIDKSKPPKTAGNILLDRLAGAEIVWIDHEDWARQGEIYAREAERLRGAGKTPYIIPEGGSNALGSFGYIDCARELAEQIGALPRKATTVIYACGSGGTGAGLILGGKQFGFGDLGIKIAGVNVCDSREFFVRRIADIAKNFTNTYQGPPIGDEDIDIIDGYVGRGYAKSRPEELACLQSLAASEAIILDPVYTGKAFYGLTRELEKDRTRFGERVVFLHTGGIFGLFPAAEQFDSLWQGSEA